MSSLPLPRFGFAVLAAILAALLAGSTASASVPNFKGSSADGSIVFFETEDQLIAGDTDTKRDVYERSFDAGVGAYVTREVSLGPTGGNDAYPAQFEGASADGERIFFSTEERMVQGDTDRALDIYVRDLETGTTTLVTSGSSACAPNCGNAEFAANFADTDAAGKNVFFETKERLAAGDIDTATDIYVRDLAAGQTSLVSAGAAGCQPGCGNGDFGVSRRGISADGAYAYFTTDEPLSSADTDATFDIYAREVGTGSTLLVSTGACAGCGNGGAVPIFDGASADGTRVFFSSEEKLVGADGDEATDVYARDLPAGPTNLISGGSEDVTASFSAASADGSHVFFNSAESLLEADGDGANDVYMWNGGNLDLVTAALCSEFCGATFEAASADSTEVVFTTAAPLVAADGDTSDDIYRQAVAGGPPVLVSRGEASCPSCWDGEFNARFSEASADASRVVFTTAEAMLSEDGDDEDDIYVRDIGAGATSLITIAPSYCPLKKGNCGATFVGSSGDGLHVFFRTVERFTLEDGDNEADVYERFLGSDPSEEVTRLVSTGNDPNLDLGPAAPILTGTNPKSPAASASPRILGEALAGASIKVYASEDCAGEPVAIGSGAELLSPGLSVTVTPGSLTTFRATAEEEGFVSGCSQPISYLQLSEGDGSEEEGEEGGGGELGNPGTAAPGLDPSTQLPTPTFLTPRTRITFAPASKTRSRSPVFRFTDSTGQPGTTFRCKVDRKSWRGCASPLRLKRLSRGKHVLSIEGINAVGTAEPQAVMRVFKVVPR
jgi:Tol biopolymer transport system component